MKKQITLKAGAPARTDATVRHDGTQLRLQTGIRAGGLQLNHNAALLRARTGIKAGPITIIKKEG